ncbi:MAG: acylphosphatase [Acidimicrobiales bacterium]
MRTKVLVEGHVQGVGFRASCGRRAIDLALGGSVRNLPGGGVEAVFEGPSGDVAALVEWCRHGPPMAHVTAVQVTAEEPLGEHSFRVR